MTSGMAGIKDKTRCDWCLATPLYMEYHDKEWARPLHDDQRLFEMLILEGAQAGLSWITILNKRNNYRAAYDNFDATKVAKYGEKKVNSLLQDAGIVRNRLKIAASITNAQAFLKVVDEFGSFDKYIWGFVNNKPIINSLKSMADCPANTDLSDKISKDLRKRGFKFVGSTIVYAYMQSIGMVDDHLNSCWRKSQRQGHS
ncbi:MAG: DNA-3-methyladenine glycosylase I [Gammaproteobacteria bacterium]|nr:DNA-3-methyladenine glycosylase I [Gammaproteobacteria bacterium]